MPNYLVKALKSTLVEHTLLITADDANQAQSRAINNRGVIDSVERQLNHFETVQSVEQTTATTLLPTSEPETATSPFADALTILMQGGWDIDVVVRPHCKNPGDDVGASGDLTLKLDTAASRAYHLEGETAIWLAQVYEALREVDPTAKLQTSPFDSEV